MIHQRITVDEFDAFIHLPQNAERLLEYIGGEVVEVPSNPYSSQVAGLILYFIQAFLRAKGIFGHVTGEAGGYYILGERYAPDVAYLSAGKQGALPYRTGYNPNPPDLAVEVLSPNDNTDFLRVKIGNYLAAGTVVWVVNPTKRQVEVYTPEQPVQIIDEGGIVSGGEVLPGFTLPVREIFPPQENI